jgi:hypothetical protein
MHRTNSRHLKELTEEIAVETGNREPLGAARSARENIDVFRTEAALANHAQRSWTRAKSQGRSHPDI